MKGSSRDATADILGITVAYARISGAASALDRDTVAFSGIGRPIRNYETAIEISHQAQIGPVDSSARPPGHPAPGGNIPDPASGTEEHAIPDALVIGMRTRIVF